MNQKKVKALRKKLKLKLPIPADYYADETGKWINAAKLVYRKMKKGLR